MEQKIKFPRSQKVYLPGKLYPNIRVAMRKVEQVPSVSFEGEEKIVTPNPEVYMYDTSGPFSDTEMSIDLKKGLPRMREEWIVGRGDVEQLPEITSEYGQMRRNDKSLDHLRFEHIALPYRAKKGEAITQMAYAKKGIITPEMEYVAIRENMNCEELGIKTYITPEFVRQEIALAVIIFVGMVFMEENETQNNSIETVSQTESDTQTEEEVRYSFDAGDLYDMRLDAQTIEDYYMKSCGDQFNLYTIDEDGVLWGSGHNEYAQIGLGYADEEFHEEKSKIAEHVVHVDYSQKDFVVYLTEEGKLYGLGNDSTYMLLQHTEMPVEDLAYPTKRYVTSPALLLEDVSYARCGRDDVVALKKDGTVWTWGMIWNYQSTGYCITMPQQILTDVKMITGGWFNHAALKEDGTLWTWGYNFSGNCGTDKATMIETPVQVAEDVQRVWTGLLNYSAKEDDITDMEEFGNDYVDNTIIEKTDGTFYACGMGVGDKSVVLPQYYEVSELDTVCSSEFLPLDWDEEMLNRKQREYIERKESQSEEAVLARKNEALLEEIDKNYDMEKLKRKVPRPLLVLHLQLLFLKYFQNFHQYILLHLHSHS